jgi:hypothetical protein
MITKDQLHEKLVAALNDEPEKVHNAKEEKKEPKKAGYSDKSIEFALKKLK